MQYSLGVVQLYHTTIANVRFGKVVTILGGCFATDSKGGRGADSLKSRATTFFPDLWTRAIGMRRLE